MNKTFFASLLCITILAFTPACSKKQKISNPKKEDVNTMIELDTTVFEIEEDNDDMNGIKF
jgi:hypothetical protein